MHSQPKSDVSDAIGNVSVVAELPSTSRASASSKKSLVSCHFLIHSRQRPELFILNECRFVSVFVGARATSSSSEDANAKSVDVNDKKLKTPRKAGVKKLAAGTPAPSAKTDAQTLLGRIVAPCKLRQYGCLCRCALQVKSTLRKFSMRDILLHVFMISKPFANHEKRESALSVRVDEQGGLKRISNSNMGHSGDSHSKRLEYPFSLPK